MMTDWLVGESFLTGKDTVLSGLIREYGHCDLKPLEDKYYFATLVKGIVSQQLSQEAATYIYKRVENIYKTDILQADEVLGTSVEDFKQVGLSGQKISYILDLSDNIVRGQIKPELFATMTDSEIMAQLLPVKGLGRWTVEMFLVFGLCRPNIWPIDDFGVKKSVNMLYGVDMKAKRTVYNELAAGWEPWRTLATWYLWKFYSENK